MLGGQKSRVIASSFILATIVALAYPHAVGFVSTSAFVNAPIVAVRAPFDGVIQTPSKQRAQSVLAGETLMEVESVRDKRVELARLRAQQQSLSGRRSALQDQVAELRALAAEFRVRRDKQRDITARFVSQKRKQALASRIAAETDLALLTLRRDRAKALSERNVVSRVQVEDLDFQLAKARAQLKREQAIFDTLAIEAEAVEVLGLAGPAPAEAPYLTQRLDEIDIRIIELLFAQRSVARELSALAPVVSEIEREMHRVDRFAPIVPTNSVIWRPSGATEATLVAGEQAVQILDCSQRFIEVTFKERHFEKIQPGSLAQVQLRGSSETFTAPVSALRGIGNDTGTQQLSAIERAQVRSSLTLFLEIPPPDLNEPGTGEAFCDVGRTAEVRIIRPRFGHIHCFLSSFLGRNCDTINTASDSSTAVSGPEPSKGRRGG